LRAVAIIGQAGSGKTTLVDRLRGELLDWQVLGIDAEREAGGDWPTLIARVARLDRPAIIETVLGPTAYISALRQYDTLFVRVTCDEAIRQARLAERGWEKTEPIKVRFPRAYEVSGESISDEAVEWIITAVTT
jgi:ribose 1,5-bisphosphokinase PhnN